MVSEPDAYNPTNGRQDKSAAVGWAHVVGVIEFLRQLPNTLCHTFLPKHQRYQRSERRPPACRPVERPCLIELLQYDNYMA
jgi:hypothetical protein